MKSSVCEAAGRISLAGLPSVHYVCGKKRRPEESMVFRIIIIVTGVLFVLVGVLWVLQGTSVVTQGFMSGQSRWTAIGSVVGIVGLVLIVLGSIRWKGKPGTPSV